MIEWLINKGVDVNGRDNKDRTALHWAFISMHPDTIAMDKEIIKLLIDQGAEVNALDKNNKTPLDLSHRFLLLFHSGDKGKYEKRSTIIHYNEMINILKENGAAYDPEKHGIKENPMRRRVRD